MTGVGRTRLDLPPDDPALSPLTGWTRGHWAAVADHLLLSLRPHFSASRARVRLPGITSSSGADSDGLESFARSFLLHAFRLRGEGGADPLGFGEWYRDGIVAGCDPANPERWPRPGEVAQAKVEAASLALGLQLTRPWLWDRLPADAQRSVIEWFSGAAGGHYPDNNWLWFRVTIETFLASVGGPHEPARIRADLATIESYYRGDGWYGDGPLRAFDQYSGWAMQFYPLLWASSDGADRFGATEFAPVFRERLTEFLDDHLALIGGDGMPVFQGRSLIYRFAAAAPLWVGAVTGASRAPMGLLRRAASGMLKGFLERGAIDERGLLSVGLFGEWPAMAQSYSGSGSPYWAAKGFLGLALPAEHPVWTAVEEPLPVERADVRRLIRPAGWVVSGTRADGIVRVINHGTDHGEAGVFTSDAPLYARLGYSTATIPPLIGGTLDSPVDNSVGALDAAGRSTSRSGFDTGVLHDDGIAAVAASTSHTHWVRADPDAPDLGAGRTGTVTDGPVLRTTSIVRGPWEVRVVRRLPGGGCDGPVRLRMSGWPVAGPGRDDTAAAVLGAPCEAERGGTVSALNVLSGAARLHVHEESGTSPLAETTAVPWAEFDDVRVGDLVAAAVFLGVAAPRDAPQLEIENASAESCCRIRWPDGSEGTARC